MNRMTRVEEEENRWLRQAEMLINRIAKNRRRLLPWLEQENISCYRIYDRDIPEIPLAVDWYEGRLLVADFSNREETGKMRRARLKMITEHLSRGLGISAGDIFVRFHSREKGGTQYLGHGQRCKRVRVKEGGLDFLVNLEDYLDTGLFLDHRKTRQLVRNEAHGKRFLNLFAYTGAFSVYAAAGGAATTTTVDLSNTYLDWAKENMRLNGFTGQNHAFIRDDILGSLEKGMVSGTYDLVVVDPPTVSKGKAMARDFNIQRDHPLVLNRLSRHVAPRGVIYFSTNFKRFTLATNDLLCEKVTEITNEIISRDFSARRGLRCWRIQAG